VRIAWTLLAAGLFAACSFRPANPVGTDALEADDAPLDALVLGPWGAPTKITLDDPTADDPTLTGDRLELYVNSSREGNADIYLSIRTGLDQAWPQPTRVEALSSGSTETTPEVSADGLTMYFASDRPGGSGSSDLWRSTRLLRTDAWGTPEPIDELNDATADTAGGVTPDGLAIAFTSFRKANVEWDIYTAVRTSTTEAWHSVTELAVVNTASHEGSAFLAADQRTLYFDTLREGGPHQLYAAVRGLDGDFGTPAPIAELNSTASDQDPWVAPDGRYMMFWSDRDGSPALWESTR
jgi:Tol biopolymer transport system component